jgi:hypothetical protein
MPRRPLVSCNRSFTLAIISTFCCFVTTLANPYRILSFVVCSCSKLKSFLRTRLSLCRNFSISVGGSVPVKNTCLYDISFIRLGIVTIDLLKLPSSKRTSYASSSTTRSINPLPLFRFIKAVYSPRSIASGETKITDAPSSGPFSSLNIFALIPIANSRFFVFC